MPTARPRPASPLSPLCQLLAAACCCATLTLLAPAAGSEEPPAAGRYQGAFGALQAHVGLVHRVAARSGDDPGAVLGLSARLATILSLGDLQLTGLASRYTARDALGTERRLGRYSVGAQLNLHPFFLTVVRNTPFWYWVAGLYGAIGADADFTTIGVGGAGGNERTEVDFGWHLGAGTDIPLTDPSHPTRSWSVWLGLAYRLKLLDVRTGAPGLDDLNEHTFLLTIAIRDNDWGPLGSLRIPRPTELDYRDPELPDERRPTPRDPVRPKLR